MLPVTAPVPAKVPAHSGEFESLLAAQGETWLTAARAELPAEVVVHTEIVWAESTSEGLLSAALAHEVDRVVVGASRHGLLQRFTLGSVANALLHASRVPVALAPRGYRAPAAVTRITCPPGRGAALLRSPICLPRLGDHRGRERRVGRGRRRPARLAARRDRLRRLVPARRPAPRLPGVTAHRMLHALPVPLIVVPTTLA